MQSLFMEYSLMESPVISIEETDMMRHNLCSTVASPLMGLVQGSANFS